MKAGRDCGCMCHGEFVNAMHMVACCDGIDVAAGPRAECYQTFERAKEAFEAGTYSAVCMAGEPVFYYPFSYGLMPGHIYSELGMDEFKISKSCEYHFDKWTAEPDEEDYEDE